MDPYHLIPTHDSGNLDLLLEDLLMEQEELQALERQQERARRIAKNLERQKNFIKLRKYIQAEKYAPRRIESAVSNLVSQKGINRNPAFQEVMEKIQEKGPNWNVTAEGIGQGPKGGSTRKRTKKTKKAKKSRRS
jgi:glycogen synthase